MKYNDILFKVEMLFYNCMAVVFIVLDTYKEISVNVANIIYICFIAVSFTYLFTFRWVFKKYNVVFHHKMYEKYYIKRNYAKHPNGYKRKGLWKVILLWCTYLGFIAFIKIIGILNWQKFLLGASVMFMLNSVFSRKLCLLSVLILHNKRHCCKSCGICAWDSAIFASALIFAPTVSTAATVLNYIIIVISIIEMIAWEYTYHRFPYRFYPETNDALSCEKCTNKCKYYKERKCI